MHAYAMEDLAAVRSQELLSKPCDHTAKYPCLNVELSADAEGTGSQPGSEHVSSSTASSQDVAYRVLYLRIMTMVEALYTLICKKVKSLATKDRNRHWLAEADDLEKMSRKGRTRELYSITRT